MQTFAVIATKQNPDLDRAVQTIYATSHQRVGNGNWLIADTGTTATEVCARLGVKRGDVDGLVDVMVVAFEDYWGHAAGSIWLWINEKQTLENGG